jgi:hypothetical protein
MSAALKATAASAFAPAFVPSLDTISGSIVSTLESVKEIVGKQCGVHEDQDDIVQEIVEDVEASWSRITCVSVSTLHQICNMAIRMYRLSLVAR